MEPQVFENITGPRFEKLKQKAQDAKISILADAGEAGLPTPLGAVNFRYAYNRDKLRLTIQCVKKPWIVGEKQITSTIQDLVTATA